MDNNEALFRLLKAINEGDREAADDAVCHLRIGIVAKRELPKLMVNSSEITAPEACISHAYSFNYSYLERINE